MAGARCVEFACPERVRRLLQAPNAHAVRQRKSNQIVEIQVDEYGDDSRLPARLGNPQELSTNREGEENPPNVWHFKRFYALDGVT